jgi:gliding motility-associated-like protein
MPPTPPTSARSWRWRALCWATGLALSGSLGANAQPSAAAGWQPVPAAPVFFRENKGQVRCQDWQPRPDVLYSGQAGGLAYHLKAAGLCYQLSRVERWAAADELFPGPAALAGDSAALRQPAQLGIYRVEVDWLGAAAACIEAEEPLPGYEHFYNVPEGASPALYVKSYRRLAYRELYPGIDLCFYAGPHGGLEYDFVVHPGADWRQIRLSVRGAELSVDHAERLILSTPFGQIAEGSLCVHQEGRPVAARWAVEGQVASFRISGPYDPAKPLVIDPPVLVWGTYYGGDADFGYACAVDGDGDVYLAGAAASAVNIATVGAHQLSLAGQRDAFLARFSPQGQRRWGTYFGGSGNDFAASCAISADGGVYLAGSTLSSFNIATPGAHQPSPNGLEDAFLARFDRSGLRQWGTYFGGSSIDHGVSCAVAGDGAVYLSGTTGSPDNIATAGAHQESPAGESDVYLAKFDSGGTLQWGTYYGGDKNDYAYACTMNADGGALLSGLTRSLGGIATPAAYQESNNGGASAFLAQFDSQGQLVWGTYFGGGSGEVGSSCATSPDGSVYLAGWASSPEGLSTAGAHQEAYGGGLTDAFLAKFDRDGHLEWGTYYGGSTTDVAFQCITDSSGGVFLAGATASTDGIATPGAHQEQLGSLIQANAFLAKFDHDGQLQWGTYFGGEAYASAQACALGIGGEVYLAGGTRSSTQIATPGAHQDALAGESNAFLARFSECAAEQALSQSACGSFEFHGETYTESGVYRQVLPGPGGCDSIFVLELEIFPSEFAASEEIVCDPALAGSDTLFLQNVYGCDSIIAIERRLGRSVAAETEAVLCPGETYVLAGQQLSAPGFYTASIPLLGGCDSTVHLRLEVSDLSLDLGGPHRLSLGDTAQLQPRLAGGPAAGWAWTDGSILSCADCWAPAARPTRSGPLGLRVWDAYGCEAYDEIFFEVAPRARLYAPTAFSPNGDGINDYFTLLAGPEVRRLQRLEVYDRWGGLLFRRESFAPGDASLGWDGRAGGKPAAAGLYLWRAAAELIDGSLVERSGEVLLLR